MIIHRDLTLGSLDHLENLRQELIANLVPIAEPRAALTRKRVQEYLHSLTAKLNQMRFEAVFRVVSGEKEVMLYTGEGKVIGSPNTARRFLSRDQRIFSRRLGKWIITMDFSPGISYSPERDFYGMIAEGLVKGELDLLRRCPYCQQFFTAKQQREIFCIPRHGRLYYDVAARAKQRVYKSRGVAD
jgi:hypothetical protein